MTQVVYKCPVPGCNYSGMAITKNHYRIEHGMAQTDVFEEYGRPTFQREDLHNFNDAPVDWGTPIRSTPTFGRSSVRKYRY